MQLDPSGSQGGHMSILVTGAAGLIGAQIVRALLDRGESVVGLDRILRTGRLDDLVSNDKVIVLEADVTDLDALDSIIRENGVDRIIHTAAILPPTSEEQPRLSYEVNISGTNNIFEAAHRNGLKRVIYPSSIATYGDQSDHGEATLDEDSMQRPFSLYGVAKLANEFAARAYTRNFGLDCRGLRICTVFGHGRLTGRSAAASAMISAAAVGDPYLCPVTADQTSAYIYIDDVAEYMTRLAFSETLERDIYCVSAHRASLRGIADHVREILLTADISFAQNATGFEQINRLNGSRLEADVTYTPPSLQNRIRHQIDMVRMEKQLPAIAAQ
jgi:nucleoside-diphosphate-sugar epimerase